MYPILIVTFLAAIYLSLMAPNYGSNPMANPTPFENEFAAYSASHGTDLALFTGGVARMISAFRSDPASVAITEIQAQLTANGGVWTVDAADIDAFLAASPYATGIGLTFADLFPPGYNVSGPWRATMIENQDVLGVGIGRIGVLLGWADINDPGMPNLDRGSFTGALSNAFGNSGNVGINEGGTLVSRGVYAAEVAFPAGNYVTHNNIPAVVPNGAPVYVQCRLAEDRGPDNVVGGGDDSADGLCD
jgi:hypothetical protein